MKTVFQLLEEKAEKYPENKVKVWGKEEMSFSDWLERANRLAHHLWHSEGIRKGDRVALLFSNDDAVVFKVCYFAVEKFGGISVPVNIRLPDEGIRYIVEKSEAKLVLCADEFEEKVKGLGVKYIKASEIRQIWESSPSTPPPEKPEPDDPLDIIWTSGTTGFPKGVVSTHSSLFVRDTSQYESMFAKTTLAHSIPLFTFAGCHAMMMLPLHYGLNVIILPKFDAKEFLKILELKEVSMVYAVPAQILLMMKLEEFEKAKLDHLRVFMFGTAPLPPWAVRKLAKKLPNTWIMNLYGATEAGMAGCFLPPGMAEKKPDSVGIPLPPTEVKIVDENGKEVPRGQVGEIWMRIPGVKPRSYWKDEEATRKTWTEDGWVKTGDLGYMDDEGYLYIVDRKKDIIIRGGFNISSVKVEGAIEEHPDVVECAVVGVPHPVLGEDVFAFVVAKRKIEEDELKRWLSDKLADNEIPRYIEFVDSLPRNATGKVLKNKLREIAKEIYRRRREAEGKEV